MYKITGWDSDGTSEHEEWFEGGTRSVYKENVVGVGGFPFLLSLLVLLYGTASYDFETASTVVLSWLTWYEFRALLVLIVILHLSYQYHLCPTPRVTLPLPFLCCLPLPFSHPILWTLSFPGSCLTALRVLFTLAVFSVIAITRTAHSAAQLSRICPVLIIIILIDCLIPILWSNSQEVARLVLPAAWSLNICPEINATVPTQMLAGVYDLRRASCLLGVLA